MRLKSQEKVIEALKLEPFLTMWQIAALFYSVRQDGKPSKQRAFNPRKTKQQTYVLPGGYDSAKALLTRMVKNGVVKKYRPHDKSRRALFYLPGHKIPLNDQHLYGHEMDCADAFVALQKTGQLTRWERHWDEEQYEAIGKRFNVWPDRIFEIDGCNEVLFLEVDRGSEEIDKQIKSKMEAYIRMGNALVGVGFRVVFTAQGYKTRSTAERRYQELSHHLAKYKRGNQFLIGLHQDFLRDPLGTLFTSPATGKVLALNRLA